MYVPEIKTYPLKAKKAPKLTLGLTKTLLHTKCYLIARNVGGRLEKLQHEDFEKVQLVW